MEWFHGRKITVKLLWGFAAVIALLAGAAIYGSLQSGSIKEASSAVESRWLPALEALNEMSRHLSAFRAAELQHALTADKAEKQSWEKALTQADGDFKRSLGGYEELMALPEAARPTDKLKKQWAAYQGEHEKVLALSRENRAVEAKALITGRSQQEFDNLSKLLQEATGESKKGGQEAAQSTAAAVSSINTLVWVLLATAVALAVALSLFLANSISRPLNRASEMAARLAEGDATAALNGSNDEVGKLAEALNRVAVYLKETAATVDKLSAGACPSNFAPRSARDMLGNSLQSLIDGLGSLTEASEALSRGEVKVKITPRSPEDALGNALKITADHLGLVSDKLEAISRGDINAQIEPRSANDLLASVVKRILATLATATKAADAMAGGELNFTIEPISASDLLGTALKRLHKNLTTIAEVADSVARGGLTVAFAAQSQADMLGNNLGRMLENLRATFRELSEGMKGLGNSANELVSLASQQTATISDQATSIQQISTTLDEIRAIVEQASERAKSVVQVSEQSLDISETGQKELDQVVDAMGKIKDQVEAIAENILDLSEKTIQIGEITSSVNDIAEQSNLLAVNAAIEATKAGEAGKGFGVVAVEVKSLAERSKKATSQVRSILTEIQKAANSTVMVTEEGSKRVESGVGQVYRIGTNIKSLHQVIVESSSAARQIASATNQQVSGIEQIAVAMKNINRGANESVAGAKQQKLTAHTLSQLATNLNGIVQRYRLN